MSPCPLCHSVVSEDKLESTTRELEIISLSELCKLMDSAIDSNTLLEMIITMTPDIVESEEASIVLVTEDRTEMVFCFAASGKSEVLQKIRLKYGEGITGWVITEDMPAVVNNVESNPKFCRRVDDKIGFKTRNILCVPIKVGNRVIGALSAVNKRNNKDFNFLDLKICEAIASQAGVAIERAKLIEENMKAARLAAIGETMTGLAHCVKNILNGLKGGEYIVNKGLEKNNPEQVKNGWCLVEKHIEKISSLVLDMLSYAKDREPDYSEVDINELIGELIELLRERALICNVKLTKKVDRNLKKVVIDSKGILRCFVNLVSNAIDACSETGGIVTVRSRLDDGGYFIVEVSDTGCGMDEKTQEILFTKFFSTKGSKGTGLGLPVAYKIIKEHRGMISVKSSLGEGTTFSIRLPLKPLQK